MSKHLTTDPSDPRLTHGVNDRLVAQAQVYLVLSEEERTKGFIRPYQNAYKHVGAPPKYPLRDLTADEHERYDQYGYVAYEEYLESESPAAGKFWTQPGLSRSRGCGGVTTMGRELSETYARDPKFYGSTYCVHCGMHLPVSEFVWESDGTVVGS